MILVDRGYQILVVFASEAIRLCAAAVADFWTCSTVAIVCTEKVLIEELLGSRDPFF